MIKKERERQNVVVMHLMHDNRVVILDVITSRGKGVNKEVGERFP